VSDLYHHMLLDASAELTWAHTKLRHQLDCTHYYMRRMERAESQRKSLIYHLRQACETLRENNWPQTAQVHLDALASLEKVYEESKEWLPVEPVRAAASDSQHDTGSAPGDRCAPVHTEAGTTQEAPF